MNVRNRTFRWARLTTEPSAQWLYKSGIHVDYWGVFIDRVPTAANLALLLQEVLDEDKR